METVHSFRSIRARTVYLKPYEFGVKVSVATPSKHCAGGQFVTHIAALPGEPYDGHTLANVVPAMQALLGNVLDRIIADAGYRGHNAPAEHKFRIYTAGQKRRVNQQIKREFKRRAAIEPVIGHLKDDHRMGRNYLAHSSGDAINAMLAAVGHGRLNIVIKMELIGMGTQRDSINLLGARIGLSPVLAS